LLFLFSILSKMFCIILFDDNILDFTKSTKEIFDISLFEEETSTDGNSDDTHLMFI
jgi:hypothetical protein